jgi:hypothetical protein
VNTSALPDCGYTGTTVAVFSPSRPRMSTTGFVSWRRPRYISTFPKNAASVPSGSCFARQGWLKNVTLSSDVPSWITASTRVRRLRVWRVEMRRTSAKTVASSPSRSSAISACFVRSW